MTAVKKQREGYVDVRVAAAWLVRAFGLDVATLEDDRRRAPHSPLSRLEREHADREPSERKLSKAERARLERALDQVLFLDRRDGERVGVTELAAQVMTEALFEVETSPGQRAELVFSGELTPTAKKAIAKRYPQPTRTRGHQRKRGMQSTLRIILLDIVWPKAETRAPKATVYLLFVLLGFGGVEAVFGEPREGETATTYLERATKTLDNVLRDRSGGGD